MEKRSISASRAKEAAAMDAKPLRTLTPMFPAALGSPNASAASNAPGFLCFTTFGAFASETGYPSGFCPLFQSSPSHGFNQKPNDLACRNAQNGFANVPGGFGTNHPGQDASTSLLFQTQPATVTPLSEVDPTSGTKKKQLFHSSSNTGGSSEADTSTRKKIKPRRPKKCHGDDTLLSSSHDPRESVETILMTFDAIRRRLMQIDESKKLRSNLKAGSIMMSNELRANTVKKIGSVPGVDVGDIFYFRIEMCLVGLHNQTMGGIDYTTLKFDNNDDTVSVGIVSAGVYDNQDDDVDSLIYVGQGSASKDDQKLERGNLALERSLHRANEIRVIRSAKDPLTLNGKIYIYDGLYVIHESWAEKGKSGFTIFKYKLLRQPGQSDGVAVWKRTEKWKANPSSRENLLLLDISGGLENVPVCVVNDVDNEKGPDHFSYSTSTSYPRLHKSQEHGQGCTCNNACLSGDLNCSCLQQNGGYFPYSLNGILISRVPIIYECGASCRCAPNCRNRVTQRGIQLHFEVFKTKDCGWGLRCWDPIRAGSFICEYAGEIVENSDLFEHSEENEHLFQSIYTNQSFKWNYVPELLGEPSSVHSSETSKSLPFSISAKGMGNISRFMNHSCSPNVFWQPVLHDHNHDDYPHIMFFAMKHIPPMTELTYDYGLSKVEVDGITFSPRTKKCLCGGAKCRGLFG